MLGIHFSCKKHSKRKNTYVISIKRASKRRHKHNAPNGSTRKPTHIVIAALLTALLAVCIYQVIALQPTLAQEITKMYRGDFNALVWNDNGQIKAIDKDFNLMFTGTDSAKIINQAFSLLTAHRTIKEKVVVLGIHTLKTAISVPSYTIFDLEGKFILANDCANHPDLIHNADPSNGNIQIDLQGGIYDGNSNGNTMWLSNGANAWNYNGLNCIYFTRVQHLIINNVIAANAGTVGIHCDSCIDVKITNSNVTNPYFHGTHFGHVGTPQEPNGDVDLENLYVEGPNVQPDLNRDYDGAALCNSFDTGINYIIHVTVPFSYGYGIAGSTVGCRTFIQNCYVSNCSLCTKRYSTIKESALSASGEVTISNCIIEHNMGDGIQTGSGTMTIQGNIIRDCQGAAIRCNSSSIVSVTGNIIQSNKQQIVLLNSKSLQSGNSIIP